MNIDAMQAGREMDALVAEKVMGCTIVGYDSFEGSGPAVKVRGCGCDNGEHNTMSDRVPDGGSLAEYSTDIAAAWGVVAELQRRVFGWSEERAYFGAQFRLSHCDTRQERTERWEAGYAYVECYDEGFVLSAEAETAPLAICRAALKAVGVKEA